MFNPSVSYTPGGGAGSERCRRSGSPHRRRLAPIWSKLCRAWGAAMAPVPSLHLVDVGYGTLGCAAELAHLNVSGRVDPQAVTVPAAAHCHAEHGSDER